MLLNTIPGEESRVSISEIPESKKNPEIVSFEEIQENIENQFQNFKETGQNLILSNQDLEFLMKDNMKYYNEFRTRHSSSCNKYLYQAISDYHDKQELEQERIRKEQEENDRKAFNTVTLNSSVSDIIYILDKNRDNYTDKEKQILSICESAGITIDSFINASVRYFIYSCMKNHISIEKNIFEDVEIEGGIA